MLVNGDAKALEWYCALILSGDQVGIQEWMNGEDQHTDNQRRFNLPSRLVAKTFLFRIIYGGSSYGFASDPNFGNIGGESFWQEAIDAFYDKYKGIHSWHKRLVDLVIKFGYFRIPCGRIYRFDQRKVAANPGFWRPKILNYGVQGFGAYLMALARIGFWKIYKETTPELKSLLINTVHDSILVDSPEEECYNISTIMNRAFEEVPDSFEMYFNYDLALPMRAEISIGKDWSSLKEITV